MSAAAFLAGNAIGPHAIERFNRLAPNLQAMVMARGSLVGTRDPTAVLVWRTKKLPVQEGEARERSRTPPRPVVGVAGDAEVVVGGGAGVDQVAGGAGGDAIEEEKEAAISKLKMRLTFDPPGPLLERPGLHGYEVYDALSPGQSQQHAKGYLDGKPVEARRIEVEIAFTLRLLPPFCIDNAAVVYHLEVPSSMIHSGDKRRCVESVHHGAFHKAGLILS